VTALLILLILLENSLPCFSGGVVSNISLGPLTAVMLAVCVDKSLSWPGRSRERAAYWLVSIIFGVLTFQPYRRSWVLQIPMQRTSLMMLVFMLIVTPLLRRKKLGSLKNVAITIPVFVLGFFVASSLTRPSEMNLADHFADNFFGSVDKSGDYLRPTANAASMAKVRRFWWETAARDWWSGPAGGLGFIPEVPSSIASGLPNDWQTVRTHPEFKSLAPISGPHNSYLTILARMGLVGLVLFAVIAIQWFRSIWPLVRGRELNLYEILVIMIPVCGAIHAALNIGLETPRNSVLLWLFAGAAIVYADAIAEAEAAATSRD
jgi:O-antigen ligase